MIGFIVNSFDCDFSKVKDYLINRYSNIKSIILNLNDRDTNVILGDKERLLYGEPYIYDLFEGIKVKISLKSFYQVNYSQMIKLYNLAKNLTNINENDDVLDLYCGIGTISLFMAKHCKHVTGVEIVPQAIENAKENAKINNINNADFVLADASKNISEYIKDKDVVILDPPRKGISKELIEDIKANRIKKIVYISCNPATLARDLELFNDCYEVSTINPVDMFPFTTHVECVVSLKIR